VSSAILYVAIVAIWAGVLIPRWLRRDSSSSSSTEQADDDVGTAQPAAAEPEPEPAKEEPAPRPRRRREPAIPAARSEGRSEGPAEAPHGEEHRRVLSARRRLLGMLLILVIGSGALAVTKMAAWWVIVPPSFMLLGYMALLREAAKADAERRELARTRAAVDRPAAQARPAAAPVAAPPPAPDAEVIDISASLTTAGEEFYDQYADAKLRAVGDLGRRLDEEDLGAAEGDVGVEGEALAWNQAQVGVTPG